MSSLDTGSGAPTRPCLHQLVRLQWEPAEETYVLLYPEGTVRLNPSAGEILARCDGAHELDDIIDELEDLFSASDLAADVYRFIDHAHQCGWVN
ncbi:pyrroloquinoline quinone biosynthesis protein D [Paraburkholderia sp. GAS41]|uniref:pyrroloquinoline quinone biosynthesis peptide chaperone PqqD n=1 Tax=Paraburkholderia sp. GAS41 TaxID=3035134 RepID=UPI003D1FB561